MLACTQPGDSAAETVTGTPGTTGTTTAGTPGGATTSSGTTSTYGWACRTDIPANELHGNYPPAEIAPPDFVAQNYDGASRTESDLMGHITVMWFYPAAGTAG